MKRTLWHNATLLAIALLAVVALSACSGSAAVIPSDTAAEAAATEAPVAETPDLATAAPADPDMGQGVGPLGTPGQGMEPGMGQGHGPDHAQGHGPGAGHGPGQGMAAGHGQGQGGPPPGRGPDNPWRSFHQQPVPEEFANLTNPVPADEASIARGREIYQTQCVMCHGESGLGDGEAGVNLDPPPAPVAMTARRMSDAYLYWRIHEGGVAFGTAMPAFGTALREEQIWDVINYLRSLEVSPADEAARQQAMLQQAVEQGVLTQDEADLFARLHTLVEDYKNAHGDELRAQAAGNPDAMLDLILQGLVDQGTITPEEADAFRDIHQRLHDAGIMP